MPPAGIATTSDVAGVLCTGKVVAPDAFPISTAKLAGVLPVVGGVHVSVRFDPLTLADSAVGASGAAGDAVTLNCTERPTGDSASRATSAIEADPVAPVTGVTVTSNVRLVAVEPVGVIAMPPLASTATLVDVAESVRVAPAVSTSVTVTGKVVGVDTTVEIAVGTPGANAGGSSTSVTVSTNDV